MPNIKSAKKRVLVNNKKTEQNKIIRSEVRTEIKKILALIKDNKLEEAQKALPCVFSVIDAACSKNILHANNAANKKSKISKKLSDALVASGAVEVKPVEVKEEVKEEVVAPVKKTTTRKTTAKKVETESK